jgi:hypothetical protein
MISVTIPPAVKIQPILRYQRYQRAGFGFWIFKIRSGPKRLVCRAGHRADSVHPTEKLCSFYHLDIQRHSRERAGIGDRGGSAVDAKYIVRGRKDTTQTVLNIKRVQGFCPWSPSREGVRDQSSFTIYATGPAVQGRSSRAPSPARHSLDLDHALPFALSPLALVAKGFNTIEKPKLTKLRRNAQDYRKIRVD